MSAPAAAPVTADELLTDATCKLERLRALYRSTTIDLGEIAESGNHDDPRVYQLWMIFVLAGEKLEEADRIIAQAMELLTPTASSRRELAA